MKATPRTIVPLVTLFLVFGARAAAAQGLAVFDHLKCYNIKDYRVPGSWKANLNPEQAPPFAAELGCKIKSPAKLFCIDVQKTPVGTPTPPLHVVGIKAQDYLCYRLVCPVPSPMPTLAVADQFGQGGIVVKKPRFLCAPAYKVGFPTPTPTPQPTPCGCVGGPNNTQPCQYNSQCPGGTCPCPSPTNPCPSSTATPVGSPTPCPKRCVGGVNNGNPCTTQSECPGGTCIPPPCCCSPQGTPPCTSSTQCAPGDVCLCP
jgi:hypothetical protein